MIPFAFVNFPLVHTLSLLERASWQAAWDASMVILGPGGVLVLLHFRYPYTIVLLYYALVSAALSAIHLALCLRAARTRSVEMGSGLVAAQ
jgi:hypothetical protein